MALEEIHVSTSSFRKTWTEAQQEQITCLIDEHFEAHDDWTDASRDMGLIYKENFILPSIEKGAHDTFAAYVVTGGDFYAEVGVLIWGFSLTDNGLILLIGQTDTDSQIVFFPIN